MRTTTEGDIPEAVLDAAIRWSLRLRSGLADDADVAAIARGLNSLSDSLSIDHQ